ncbi:hypothetical protein QLX08_007006 [Tetragonisca angustula]|uniref:Uncharacterized protein n=1 Tax=Tetragonisca angustula TaxID=166442 RepID=A0AAW0ZTE5_9HYME
MSQAAAIREGNHIPSHCPRARPKYHFGYLQRVAKTRTVFARRVDHPLRRTLVYSAQLRFTHEGDDVDEFGSSFPTCKREVDISQYANAAPSKFTVKLV